MYDVYYFQQVTKNNGPEKVSGPLTYNDISASPEGRRDTWTDRERDWEEAEALDTGQERPDITGWSLAVSGRRGGAWGRAGVDSSRFICHLTSWSPLCFAVRFVFSVLSVSQLKWVHDEKIIYCCVEGRMQPKTGVVTFVKNRMSD